TPCHGGTDLGRILAAWVVVGDDEQVAAACGHLPHHGAFHGVPVTTATEHGDHAMGGTLPQRFQHHRDRGGLVRIVDDGGEGLAHVDPFHPAGYVRGGQPRGNG